MTLETYCPKASHTYTLFPTSDEPKNWGGFSDIIVVNHRFALRFPDALPPEGGAPLLYAGITVYSPMKYFGLNEAGKHVGVVGLGGLGHLAGQSEKASHMKVTVIGTSSGKKEEAIRLLGSDSFFVSKDSDQMKATVGTLDGIINTIPAPPGYSLVPPRGEGNDSRSAARGLKETQEMLDFAVEHIITGAVELIPMDSVNPAMARLEKGQFRHRRVIDVAITLGFGSA